MSGYSCRVTREGEATEATEAVVRLGGGRRAGAFPHCISHWFIFLMSHWQAGHTGPLEASRTSSLCVVLRVPQKATRSDH